MVFLKISKATLTPLIAIHVLFFSPTCGMISFFPGCTRSSTCWNRIFFFVSNAEASKLNVILIHCAFPTDNGLRNH